MNPPQAKIEFRMYLTECCWHVAVTIIFYLGFAPTEEKIDGETRDLSFDF